MAGFADDKAVAAGDPAMLDPFVSKVIGTGVLSEQQLTSTR
jgi:hypothetical protein